LQSVLDDKKGFPLIVLGRISSQANFTTSNVELADPS